MAPNQVSVQREGRGTSLRFLKTRRSSWGAALPRLRTPALRTTCIDKGGLGMLPADACRAAGGSRPVRAHRTGGASAASRCDPATPFPLASGTEMVSHGRRGLRRMLARTRTQQP